MPNKKLLVMVARALDIRARLLPILLDVSVGLVAFEACIGRDGSEITTDYVLARLGSATTSEDTIRRRLKKMAKCGVLDTRREGRTVFYEMSEETAKRVAKELTRTANSHPPPQ